jgi:hypothetical protein
VSIEVAEPWRAAVLRAEARLRGLVALIDIKTPEVAKASENLNDPEGAQEGADEPEQPEPPPKIEPVITFRTAFSAVLAPLADRWLPTGRKEVPKRFALDGRRLRLWVAAAGSPDGVNAFRLRADLDVEDALNAVGLPVTAVDAAYKIVGRRRLARLAELIGEPPAGVPPGAWPV